MQSITRKLAFACLILAFTYIQGLPSGKRILLYPVDHPGHVNYHLVLGKALVKSGYDVYMLGMEKHRAKIEAAGVKPLLHKPIKAVSIHDDTEIQDMIQEVILVGEKGGIMATMPVGAKVMARVTNQTEEILQNKVLQGQIKDLSFDLALIDTASVLRTPLVVAYKHGIRFIPIAPLPDPWGAGLPGMPSVEPLPMIKATNDMSFLERIQSLFVYIMLSVLPRFTESDHLVAKYVPDKPCLSLAEIYSQAEMFFVNTDPYLLDYPRISGTNYVFLGATGGAPVKPLEPELEKFVSSAKDGSVVVSFGSVAKKLPSSVLSKLLGAFTLFPSYHFAMRHDGDATDVPENVKLLKWLPQNDLLGHKNTRAFISHGGNNGQIEALYHGVPTLVAPLFGDQVYNAIRFTAKGYGVKVNLLDSTEGDVVDALREVLGNPKYKDTMKKARAIHHVLPKGNETVVFWVDHVIKYGSDHLKPVSMSLPLYKLFMLDVILVIFLVLVFSICTCYKCTKWCCRKCCGQSKTSKKKKKD